MDIYQDLCHIIGSPMNNDLTCDDAILIIAICQYEASMALYIESLRFRYSCSVLVSQVIWSDA